MAPRTRLADSAGRGRLPKADPQGLLGGPVCHFEAMPKACCFCDSGQQRQPKSSNVPKRGQGERVISEKGQPGGGLPGDTGHISWGTSLGLYVKAPQSCPPDKDEQPGGPSRPTPRSHTPWQAGAVTVLQAGEQKGTPAGLAHAPGAPFFKRHQDQTAEGSPNTGANATEHNAAEGPAPSPTPEACRAWSLKRGSVRTGDASKASPAPQRGVQLACTTLPMLRPFQEGRLHKPRRSPQMGRPGSETSGCSSGLGQ